MIRILPLVLALGGCASMAGLPYPRWAEVGRQWGCEPLAVQQANIQAAQQRGRGSPDPVPQVGWDACKLLAESGEPREVRSIQTEAGRSYSLYYRRFTGDGPTHLVTLEPDGKGGWRVSGVVW